MRCNREHSAWQEKKQQQEQIRNRGGGGRAGEPQWRGQCADNQGPALLAAVLYCNVLKHQTMECSCVRQCWCAGQSKTKTGAQGEQQRRGIICMQAGPFSLLCFSSCSLSLFAPSVIVFADRNMIICIRALALMIWSLLFFLAYLHDRSCMSRSLAFNGHWLCFHQHESMAVFRLLSDTPCAHHALSLSLSLSLCSGLSVFCMAP